MNNNDLKNFEHLICAWPQPGEPIEFAQGNVDYKSMGPEELGSFAPESCGTNSVMTNIKAYDDLVVVPPNEDGDWDDSKYMFMECKKTVNYLVNDGDCHDVSLTTGSWTGPYDNDDITNNWNYWFLCPDGNFTVQITRKRVNSDDREADVMKCCSLSPKPSGK